MWIHVTLCLSEFVWLQSNSCWHHWVKEADAPSSPGNHAVSPILSSCWGYQQHQDWPLEKSLERWDLVLSILFSLNLLLCYFFRQATNCICFLKLSSAATANIKPKKSFGLKSQLYIVQKPPFDHTVSYIDWAKSMAKAFQEPVQHLWHSQHTIHYKPWQL